MDSPHQPGLQPSKGENWPAAFLVIFFVIIGVVCIHETNRDLQVFSNLSNTKPISALALIGYYLMLNLLVCGVVRVYDRLKEDSRHAPEMTKGQHELIDALRLMVFFRK
jgi:hypothetical protein